MSPIEVICLERDHATIKTSPPVDGAFRLSRRFSFTSGLSRAEVSRRSPSGGRRVCVTIHQGGVSDKTKPASRSGRDAGRHPTKGTPPPIWWMERDGKPCLNDRASACGVKALGRFLLGDPPHNIPYYKRKIRQELIPKAPSYNPFLVGCTLK